MALFSDSSVYFLLVAETFNNHFFFSQAAFFFIYGVYRTFNTKNIKQGGFQNLMHIDVKKENGIFFNNRIVGNRLSIIRLGQKSKKKLVLLQNKRPLSTFLPLSTSSNRSRSLDEQTDSDGYFIHVKLNDLT
ncbi:hypothetical protein BpHYR1_015956 [Brachionus plicatilis]|uniref:Uncharacterized protein n=1 Tax=Brachionus plicatilis TaxID=10195 RepID=A0A3M7PLC9_BRAPC|nr:hypothetical protein BpHYR1_015956 [Brachionus plicatilis]